MSIKFTSADPSAVLNHTCVNSVPLLVPPRSSLPEPRGTPRGAGAASQEFQTCCTERTKQVLGWETNIRSSAVTDTLTEKRPVVGGFRGLSGVGIDSSPIDGLS